MTASTDPPPGDSETDAGSVVLHGPVLAGVAIAAMIDAIEAGDEQVTPREVPDA